MKKLFVVLVIAIMLASCATETDITEKNADGSPIWTTEVPQSNKYVYGVGSAKLSNQQNSRTAADANARADLSRKLTIKHVVDFIAISSYGEKGDKRGEVRLLMDTRENLADHHVLIVEDILDSGNTLSYLIKTFKSRGVKSIETAVFLDKPERHEVDVPVEYVGFEIPDVWVVGYGLDYKEQYRTLPYIAEMYPRK